jgi:type I restriction enzyme R subunit
MQTLRDDDFKRLLDDYPRGQRTFIVAPNVNDTVGSEWLIRGADGQRYKPDDYITVFFDFVRDNSAAIDALAILLSRPKDWNPDALLALRDALKGAPQHFTEQNLERAFRARYHKALVDIISMVKHAAADAAPLLTATERVDAAISRSSTGAS